MSTMEKPIMYPSKTELTRETKNSLIFTLFLFEEYFLVTLFGQNKYL